MALPNWQTQSFPKYLKPMYFHVLIGIERIEISSYLSKQKVPKDVLQILSKHVE